MDIPIPYFGYTKNGLKVSFKNLSLGNPTGYSWGFGDDNESTDKDPVHVYSEPGFYLVTLVAIKEEQQPPLEEPPLEEPPVEPLLIESLPFQLTIGVGDTTEIANVNLLQLIDEYLPKVLLGSATVNKKAALINKWQLYLQPLIWLENPEPGLPPLQVSVENTHNEFAWPSLFNYLIAQLCAYDIVLQGMNQFLALSGSLADGVGSLESDETGGLKSIETGPAKTEWYENKPAEELAEIGKAYTSASRVGGPLDKLQQSICQFAARLRVYLPMCGQLPHNTIAPQVASKTCKIKHNANPFGITKRMI